MLLSGRQQMERARSAPGIFTLLEIFPHGKLIRGGFGRCLPGCLNDIFDRKPPEPEDFLGARKKVKQKVRVRSVRLRVRCYGYDRDFALARTIFPKDTVGRRSITLGISFKNFLTTSLG